MDELGRAFLDRSTRYLTDDYLPRIRASVERLDAADLWWRPNEASNSVGNLLLHLAGNLRQWVVSGAGGAEDVRVRHEEFGAVDGADAEELVEGLADVVFEAADTLGRLDPSVLLDRRTVQGNDVTVFEAVYHAVEHFSMHTGQIIWIVKARTGEDAGFYRVRDGVAKPTWTPATRSGKPDRGPVDDGRDEGPGP